MAAREDACLSSSDVESEEADARSVRSVAAASVGGKRKLDTVSPAKSKAQEEPTPPKKGRGRGQQGAQGETFHCTLCSKMKPVTERVPGFQWERACKQAYDAMSRLSKKQGEHKWWDEVKANPKKLKSVVLDFQRMFPPRGRGSARAKNFKLGEYKEFIRATTEVQRRVLGKMMWEDEWLEWAQTTPGGSHSKATAQAKWQEMKLDTSVLRCQDGPAHSPLMLRIKTGIMIDSLETVAVGKQFEASTGQVKKPSEADCQQFRDQVMQAHDKVCGIDTSDVAGIAKAMVDAGGSAAEGEDEFKGIFQQEGLANINLRQAFMGTGAQTPASSSQSRVGGEVEDQSEDEQHGQHEQEEPAQKKTRKVASYFDKVRINGSNVSAWALSCQQWTKDAQDLSEKMGKMWDTWAFLENDDDMHSGNDVVKPCLASLKRSMHCLSLVRDVGSLVEYQNEIKAGRESPPIQKYLDLMTLKQVAAEGKNKFNECESHDDTAQAKRLMTCHKNALNDLMTSCRASIKDVNKAVKGRESLATIAKSENEKVAIAAGKATGAHKTVFELVSEWGQAVPAIASPVGMHDKQMNMKLSEPVIVTQLQSLKQDIKDNGPLQVLTHVFRKKWEKHHQNTREARKVAASDSIRSLQNVFLSCFQDDTLISEAKAEASTLALQPVLGMSNFAMSQGEVFSYMELHGAASFRVACVGTRAVICAHLGDILSLLKEKADAKKAEKAEKAHQEKEQTIVERACACLQNITRSQAQELKNRARVYGTRPLAPQI